MNINRIYRRIPDRVRIGGSVLAFTTIVLAGPRLLAWWLRLWI